MTDLQKIRVGILVIVCCTLTYFASQWKFERDLMKFYYIDSPIFGSYGLTNGGDYAINIPVITEDKEYRFKSSSAAFKCVLKFTTASQNSVNLNAAVKSCNLHEGSNK